MYAIPLPDDALSLQTASSVEIVPEVSQAILRTCYEHALSIVDVHSHPAARAAEFSAHDQSNTIETHQDFYATVPGDPPVFAASLVVAREATAGIWFDPDAGCLAPTELVVLTDVSGAV